MGRLPNRWPTSMWQPSVTFALNRALLSRPPEPQRPNCYGVPVSGKHPWASACFRAVPSTNLECTGHSRRFVCRLSSSPGVRELSMKASTECHDRFSASTISSRRLVSQPGGVVATWSLSECALTARRDWPQPLRVPQADLGTGARPPSEDRQKAEWLDRTAGEINNCGCE